MAALLVGTYKGSCDVVAISKRVPSVALFITPNGLESFECDAVDGECIWELRALADMARAYAVILTAPGHKPGARVQVAVFYAEVHGASWVAHCAVTPHTDESGPEIVEPIFDDGARSSFYPLLKTNNTPGTPLIPTDAG
jgi:hypothetical protein